MNLQRLGDASTAIVPASSSATIDTAQFAQLGADAKSFALAHPIATLALGLFLLKKL